MLTVKLSNKKPQEASKSSESIQGANLIYVGHLENPTSKKEIIENRKETKRQLQVIKAAPFGDKNLPKHIENVNPIKGRKIKDKYI